ncbi:hypothetical protein ES754_04250 [Psychrobacter frigidicola]|uniref:DUF11 domain-containing protein n=1 Tax=Psychrobacter frigidicola TaxID=45611 RepID=A0A5C7A3F8_9GAMM|nr:hypothetical protein [Psychrobacter frigidicola]TXD98157.1 hypothetical protein ES754_04250 [Psychrobacter frigidicola]
MKTAYSLKQLIIAASVSATFLSSALAADTLKMELQANKISKGINGKSSYIAASDAKIGETVQYRAIYTNVIEQPISNVAVILPIPANMTFTGEAKPISAQATVDGKNYADMPLMRRVNGKVVKIPLSEYRALRWNIKWLPASKSADVSMNTIVN